MPSIFAKSRAILAFAFLITACTSSASEQALLDAALADTPLFSGSATISRRGIIVAEIHTGLADREDGRANTSETRFSIGSVGKLLTAHAVISLAEQDRLDLETPVASILPELGDDIPASVTLDHLLQQQSGLQMRRFPDDSDLEGLQGNHDRFELFATLGMFSDGPANFRYFNPNFVILGEVIARVTGQSYEAHMRHHLAGTGVSASGFLRDGDIARPYMPTDYETWWNSETSPQGETASDYQFLAPETSASAAGGAFFSAQDMSRLINLVANSEQGEMLCGLITETDGRGYGRGCSVRHDHYGRRYGHNGSTAGVHARVYAYPDQGYEIVVLANHDGQAAPLFEAIQTRLFPDDTEN